MRKRALLEITGNEEDLQSFLSVCRIVNTSCTYGSGRTISVKVDGDGSGDLKFSLFNGSEYKELDLVKHSEWDALDEDIDVYIGE